MKMKVCFYHCYYIIIYYMAAFYLISTSLLVFLASGFTSVYIFRKEKKDKPTLSFAMFWIWALGTWFFIALATLFWKFNLLDYSKLSAYISYLFAVAQGPFAVYYLLRRIFGQIKFVNWFFVFYSVSVLPIFYFLFKDGLPAPQVSEWGLKFGLPSRSFFIFKILFILLFVLIVIEFVKIVYSQSKSRYLKNSRIFLATLSLIIYLAVGYFEAGGLVSAWQLMFTRILALTSALCAFLAYYLIEPGIKKDVYEI